MSGENGFGGGYHYALQLYQREPHALLATQSVEPDWIPALEWARFQAVRECCAPQIELGEPRGQIEPVFDREHGAPYVAALRAVAESANGASCEAEIPLTYFHELARSASSPLVAAGRLAAGELFEYRVCAYAHPPERAEVVPAGEPPRPGTWEAEITPLAQTVRLAARRLDDYLAAAVPQGTITTEQFAVLIPASVLGECIELMRRAAAVETGGILLGHLRRDLERRDIFVEVTAQIPAQQAQQELCRLTFTPETWASVEAALALRGQDELWVGWWHTHPSDYWCRDCPPEKKGRCPAAGRGDYFSTHDVRLHRTVFPRAYSLALVLGGGCEAGAQPHCRLFGWQQGMIASRGYYLLYNQPRGGSCSDFAPAAAATFLQQKGS